MTEGRDPQSQKGWQYDPYTGEEKPLPYTGRRETRPNKGRDDKEQKLLFTYVH